ncbi:MAG: hypothetical protein HY922_10975 [Elusimicrobia bacterium]|nr:hypothetical protein [Elusimicrobiota bacterium]
MKNLRIPALVAAVVLSASAGLWAAGSGAASQVQDAVKNTAGVMDGSAVRRGLDASPVLASGIASGEAQAAAETARQTSLDQGLKNFSRLHLDRDSLTAKVNEPAQPAPGPVEKIKQGLKGVYKWMVRNPVEMSFFVSIPVTFFFGATAGTIAGFAVYFFLQSRQKKPF